MLFRERQQETSKENSQAKKRIRKNKITRQYMKTAKCSKEQSVQMEQRGTQEVQGWIKVDTLQLKTFLKGDNVN